MSLGAFHFPKAPMVFLARLQGCVVLLCTLTTGHAVIPFCRVSVGSPGVRCLGECSGRSLHPPGKAAIHPHLFLCHWEAEGSREGHGGDRLVLGIAGTGLEMLPGQSLGALSLITLEGLLARGGLPLISLLRKD